MAHTKKTATTADVRPAFQQAVSLLNPLEIQLEDSYNVVCVSFPMISLQM